MLRRPTRANVLAQANQVLAAAAAGQQVNPKRLRAMQAAAADPGAYADFVTQYLLEQPKEDARVSLPSTDVFSRAQANVLF